MKTLTREEILSLPTPENSFCPLLRVVNQDFRDDWAGKSHFLGESYCVDYIGSENIFGKGLCQFRITEISNESVKIKCKNNGSEFSIPITQIHTLRKTTEDG